MINYQTFEEAVEKANKFEEIDLPGKQGIYTWVHRGVISDCDFREFDEDEGTRIGYWSPLLHLEIATAAYLKKGYKLTDIAEVAETLRKPLRLTGGLTGMDGAKGFWDNPKIAKRTLKRLLGKDLDLKEYIELFDRPQLENRIVFDYLEAFEYFERQWELIKDPEIKV